MVDQEAPGPHSSMETSGKRQQTDKNNFWEALETKVMQQLNEKWNEKWNKKKNHPQNDGKLLVQMMVQIAHLYPHPHPSCGVVQSKAVRRKQPNPWVFS